MALLAPPSTPTPQQGLRDREGASERLWALKSSAPSPCTLEHQISLRTREIFRGRKCLLLQFAERGCNFSAVWIISRRGQ